MRNPVATPASVIFGILVLGFGFFVLMAFLNGETNQIIVPFRPEVIWGNAFLNFIAHFAALQCAGALIAYSLFLSPPVYQQKIIASKKMTSIIISIVLLTSMYIVFHEALVPVVRKNLSEKKALSTFSTSIFKKAHEKEKENDLVTAVEYIRLSLAVDRHNPLTISENSRLIAELSPAEFREYVFRTAGESGLESFDSTQLLTRAENALEKKNYVDAYYFARQVLAIDNSHKEALRISSIARESDFEGIESREKSRAAYLFSTKQQGYDALTSTDHPDFIRAYFIFLDLNRQFPFDETIRDYLQQSRQLLPQVSFFTHEAELILSFDALKTGPIVFFNRDTNTVREIITIESIVQIGDGIFLKNIEVIGLNASDAVQYHYLAPIGKILEDHIIINGIDRIDPKKQTRLTVYQGTPPIDQLYGILLFPDTKMENRPKNITVFGSTQKDFDTMNIADLVLVLPFVAHHAQLPELIYIEIAGRVLTPFFIIMLTLICLVIGMKHSVQQEASSVRHLYLLVPVVPFVMANIIGFFLFLHRIFISFSFYAMGFVFCIILLSIVHIVLLILVLGYFSGKVKLRNKTVF
ncbi:MAG: hypothetical protein JW904_13490 [Spirochaetales bacterium]|nr:hypothetical protein [Spirochaetales bacterium]